MFGVFEAILFKISFVLGVGLVHVVRCHSVSICFTPFCSMILDDDGHWHGGESVGVSFLLTGHLGGNYGGVMYRDVPVLATTDTGCPSSILFAP